MGCLFAIVPFIVFLMACMKQTFLSLLEICPKIVILLEILRNEERDQNMLQSQGERYI